MNQPAPHPLDNETDTERFERLNPDALYRDDEQGNRWRRDRFGRWTPVPA